MYVCMCGMDRCASCEESRAAVENLSNQVRALHKQNQLLQEKLSYIHQHQQQQQQQHLKGDNQTSNNNIHTRAANDSDICLAEDSLFGNNSILVRLHLHTYIHTYIHTYHVPKFTISLHTIIHANIHTLNAKIISLRIASTTTPYSRWVRVAYLRWTASAVTAVSG